MTEKDSAAKMQQAQETALGVQPAGADGTKGEWYEHVSLEDAKAFIRANLLGAARNFISIGYFLKHVRDKELFREDGHDTIWEFAQAEYGISKSTASRYMAMNDRFSKNGNSPAIDSRYRNFDKSKLQEMLSLTDAQIEQVNSDMAVKEIRGMRAPREIPYFEIDGQLDIETDFPELVPVPAPNIHPPAQQVFTMDMAELVGEKIETDIVAISQQQDIQTVGAQKQTSGPGECYYRPGYPCSPESLVYDMKDIKNPSPELEQTELPLLKNNGQRKEWLDGFRDWPVWFDVPQSSEIYFRYDLPDGSSLVICEYHYWADWIERYGHDENPDRTGVREYILTPGYHYLYDCQSNRSALIDKLKEIQKKK